MAGSDFILPMAAGAALSWASYSMVAHVTSKQQISSLRAISWGVLGTISLVLGVCAFSAHGAENPAVKQTAYSPEYYAKNHHNPVRECKETMHEKSTFQYVWLENEAQPIFNTYLWHDEKKRTIQAFGHKANAINSLNMLIPLQYFCIFNANTGEVIAASFE
ncbi:hypothetical protein AB6849_25825 [Serratia proteamaculans]|uniref:hypothetical protein n=1 Tax=Serratia proteamaculans TaxID=28151 RepID=UPI001C58FE0B|nr:hypothetical protein [Serratia proteamaculans]WEO90163.1 hypothetical protein JET59_002735 [Serratia proteamaculans]